MTPEERARAALKVGHAGCRVVQDGECSSCADGCASELDAIASAIRDAENEALERAAVARPAEPDPHLIAAAANVYADGWLPALEAYQKAIRALKKEDPAPQAATGPGE